MIVNDLIKQFKDNSKDGKGKQAYINEYIVCEVCGSIKPRKNMIIHTNTPRCKRRANIIRYEKLYGSTYTWMCKHIASCDVDFDGVIKLEEDEKIKSGYS